MTGREHCRPGIGRPVAPDLQRPVQPVREQPPALGLAVGEPVCESCRRARATVRALFDDGAVFAVCQSCSVGALSQSGMAS